jgi:hypothetical protein
MAEEPNSKRKVITMLSVSDYSQLKKEYGNVRAEEVLSNLQNQFVGKQPLEPLAEYLIKDSLDSIDKTGQEIQQVFKTQRIQMIRTALIAAGVVIIALTIIAYFLLT